MMRPIRQVVTFDVSENVTIPKTTKANIIGYAAIGDANQAGKAIGISVDAMGPNSPVPAVIGLPPVEFTTPVTWDIVGFKAVSPGGIVILYLG
jgi:hypothetical protein